NSSIKASSLVIVGAAAQYAQSFCGILHIVHASLMSQESQKFPLLSIPTVFCQSHQHNLHHSRTGARKLKRRPLPPNPYEQQYAEATFLKVNSPALSSLIS